MAKKENKPKTTKSVRKRKTPDPKRPSWCITHGWGNTSKVIDGWHICNSSEQAYNELAKAAKGKFPRRYHDVWVQSFLDDGVVCDFGSHVYFGFLKNYDPPVPENLRDPGPTKPPRPVPAPEYLDCLDGIRLRELFNQWTLTPKQLDKEVDGWWRTHALQYCLIKEWWDMFVEEEPCIDEIWERDLTPDEIFCNVLKWSAECSKAADILCPWRPCGRWDAFHAPLNMRRE